MVPNADRTRPWPSRLRTRGERWSHLADVARRQWHFWFGLRNMTRARRETGPHARVRSGVPCPQTVSAAAGNAHDADTTGVAYPQVWTPQPVRPWVAPLTRTGTAYSDVQAVMNSQFPPDPPKQRFATVSGAMTAGSLRDGAMGVTIRPMRCPSVPKICKPSPADDHSLPSTSHRMPSGAPFPISQNTLPPDSTLSVVTANRRMCRGAPVSETYRNLPSGEKHNPFGASKSSATDARWSVFGSNRKT